MLAGDRILAVRPGFDILLYTFRVQLKRFETSVLRARPPAIL